MRIALIFLAVLLTCQTALAAKLAIIKSNSAIIYSDVELKSAIGKLIKGTKIKIGERYRRQGMVAYTELQNKIVYIKVSDLLIQGSKKIALENNSRFRANSIKEINREILTPEQYFSVSAGTSTPGKNWQELANKMGANPNGTFYFVEAQFEYYFSGRKFAVDAGFGYVQNSDPNLQLNMTTLFSKIHWIPINIRLAEFHLYGGVTGSPWMLIQTENGQYYTKGSSIGGTFGGEVRLFPGKKLTIAAGSNYQSQRLFGHEKIQLPGKYLNLTGITSYSETRVYANLAVRF